MRPSNKRNAKDVAPPPTADPTVLTYLHLASKAFPAVEAAMDRQQQAMLTETLTAMERADTLDAQLDTQVRRYRSERDRAASEEEERIARALFLEKQIIAEDDRFEAEMVELEERHDEKCRAIQEEVDRLAERAGRAAAWEAIRVAKKEELATLEAKVAALRAQHKSEIKVMLVDHEEERRKLRDVLVRKLRTMRDYMTIDDDTNLNALSLAGAVDDLTGDDPAPQSLAINPNQQGTRGAVKLTERLSREVTTYERESAATSTAIVAHEAQRDVLQAKLRSAREANERLVFKNAANAQSLKMLTKKIAEIRAARAAPSDAAADIRSGPSPRRTMSPRNAAAANSGIPFSSSPRRAPPSSIGSGALVTRSGGASLAMQVALGAEQELRAGLEEELAATLDEVAAADAARHEAEHQLLAQIEKDLNALEFVESLGTLLSPASDSDVGASPNRNRTPATALRTVMDSRHEAISRRVGRVGSGDVALRLPPIGKKAGTHSTAATATASGGDAWVPEPVYAIGLRSAEEIQKFLSVSMNCLLASVPRDVVGGLRR